MLIDLQQAQIWIYEYKYFIIFPLAFIEGPIITVMAGLFAAAGYLNFILTYVLIVTGDLAADTFYYVIGRYAHALPIYRFGKYIGLHPEGLAKIERYFKEHSNTTFTLGKMTYGPGLLVLVAAGIFRVPYGRFIIANTVLTLVKSGLLLLVGFYFGRALVQIHSYLDVTALVMTILFVGAYVAFIKFFQPTKSIERSV